MEDAVVREERAEDELDLEAVGTTKSLGAEGWEACEYVEPDETWTMLGDGSYLSPDGRIRSWPPVTPNLQ